MKTKDEHLEEVMSIIIRNTKEELPLIVAGALPKKETHERILRRARKVDMVEDLNVTTQGENFRMYESDAVVIYLFYQNKFGTLIKKVSMVWRWNIRLYPTRQTVIYCPCAYFGKQNLSILSVRLPGRSASCPFSFLSLRLHVCSASWLRPLVVQHKCFRHPVCTWNTQLQ